MAAFMFPIAVIVLIVTLVTHHKLRSFWIAAIVALTLLGIIILLIDFIISPVGLICLLAGALILAGRLLYRNRDDVAKRRSMLWAKFKESNLLVKIGVPTVVGILVLGSLTVAFRPKTVALWFEDDGMFQICRLSVIPSAGMTMDGRELTGVYPFDERSLGGNSWRDVPWQSDTEFLDSSISQVVVSDGIRPTSCERWFSGFSECRSFDLSECDLSACTSTAYMFYGCDSATGITFGAGSSSSLLDASGMFSGCESLASVDLSSFDFSECDSLRMMFSGCSSLSAVEMGDANLSKATDLTEMFYDCTALSIDCGDWKVSSAQNAEGFSKGANGVTEPEWPSGCEADGDEEEQEYSYTPRRRETKSSGQCLAPRCENRARNKCGYCNSHHIEYCDDPYCVVDKCKVPGCDNVGSFSGYCRYHYYVEDLGQ